MDMHSVAAQGWTEDCILEFNKRAPLLRSKLPHIPHLATRIPGYSTFATLQEVLEIYVVFLHVNLAILSRRLRLTHVHERS